MKTKVILAGMTLALAGLVFAFLGCGGSPKDGAVRGGRHFLHHRPGLVSRGART
jgi:hypothetical protein